MLPRQLLFCLLLPAARYPANWAVSRPLARLACWQDSSAPPMNKFSSVPDSEFRPWTNSSDLDTAIDTEIQQLEETLHFTSSSRHAGHRGDSEIDLKPDRLRVFDAITAHDEWLDAEPEFEETEPESSAIPEVEFKEIKEDTLPKEETPFRDPSPTKKKTLITSRRITAPSFRFQNTPPGQKKRSKQIKAVKCSRLPVPAIASISAVRFRELLHDNEGGPKSVGSLTSDERRPLTAAPTVPALVSGKQHRPKSASNAVSSKTRMSQTKLPVAVSPNLPEVGSRADTPTIKASPPLHSMVRDETTFERVVTPLSLLQGQSKSMAHESIPSIATSPINPASRTNHHLIPKAPNTSDSNPAVKSRDSQSETRFKRANSISSALQKLQIAPEDRGILDNYFAFESNHLHRKSAR